MDSKHESRASDVTAPAPVHAPDDPASKAAIAAIDARLHAVEQLIKIFRLERYIYLSISIASFLVIVVFAAYIFASSDGQGRSSLFVVLFAAPSGALLYVSAAFLKMWTQDREREARQSQRGAAVREPAATAAPGRREGAQADRAPAKQRRGRAGAAVSGCSCRMDRIRQASRQSAKNRPLSIDEQGSSTGDRRVPAWLGRPDDRRRAPRSLASRARVRSVVAIRDVRIRSACFGDAAVRNHRQS